MNRNSDTGILVLMKTFYFNEISPNRRYRKQTDKTLSQRVEKF